MIFWWGARGGVATVGASGQGRCSACDKDSWWTRIVSYRVRHAYWLFRWVTGRQLFDVCGNCGATVPAEGDPKAPEVTKAIPAFDRRGWLAGAGAVGSLVVLATVAGASIDRTNQGYAAAPLVGDVLKADLARIVAKPEAPVMYGAMRVVAVRGDQVELALPRTFYDKRRGVDRDVTRNRTREAAYWAPDHLTLPRSAVAKLYADGVVSGIER